MDGTISDSTAALEKLWHLVAEDIGADPKLILQGFHGRRTIKTLKIVCPEKATEECGTLIPEIARDSAIAVRGAKSLLESVVLAKVPWAIVTSGTVSLVKGFLDMLKLPHPEHLVTAEMGEHGKPDPACYMLDRKRLNLADGARTLLKETPAGIMASKAAGCQVLSVVTTHALEQVVAAEPNWVVQDLRSVTLVDSVRDDKYDKYF